MYMNLDTIAISVILAEKQMTKRELAKISGINESNLSTALKRHKVYPATAGKIAAALSVPVEKIIVNGGGGNE